MRSFALQSTIYNLQSPISGHREFWSRKDFSFDLRPLVGDRLAEIILRLEADQKRCRNAEVALEPQGCIGGDAFSPGKDIAETAARNGHVAGGLGGGNRACFQLIVNEAGGGVGAEFHEFSGCLRF